MFNLGNSWDGVLNSKIEESFLSQLREKVNSEYALGTVYPPKREIFRALTLTDFDKVKAVIIGQDPYFNENQANGLAFSVYEGVKLPPSLVNIYTEIKSDLGIDNFHTGELEKWAEQGVLLLNASLTVRAGQANSHSKLGWIKITDAIIESVGRKRENVVFMLWGGYARKKKELIDTSRHLILESVHPSPLSAYNGFFGCKHFSKANDYLISKGISPIDWQL